MKRGLLLGLILLGAAALRAGYLLAPHIDSDQATFGLTAAHILKGEFPIFQWGYHYLGTLQCYLDAAAFWFFGMSREVLNGVTIFFALLLIWLTYLLGRTLVDTKTGLWAAFFSAFGPFLLVIHGAWARHGYIETLVFGSALLLFTAKIVYQKLSPASYRRYLIQFGLVTGLAWWTHYLILDYLLPCSLLIWWRDKKLPLKKEFYLAALAFLVGSLPFWVYNFQHNFASLEMFQTQGTIHLWDNVILFFSDTLPPILQIHLRENPLFWNLFPAAIYVFCAGWLLTHRKPRSLQLPALFVAIVFLLTVTSRFGRETTSRYLLPLYSVLPIFLAHTICTLWKKSKGLATLFLGSLLAVTIYENLPRNPLLNPERIAAYRQDQKYKREMAKVLEEKNIAAAYSIDYWVGPQLTFDCKEKWVFPHPFVERYPLYTRFTDSLWNPAFLTVGGSSNLEEALNAMNVRYEKFTATPYVFYHAFKRVGAAAGEIPVEGWKLTASDNSKEAGLAADRNLRTAWMSSEYQKPGMEFTLELPQAEDLCQIELLLGNAWKWSPKEMDIAISRDGKNWNRLAYVPKKWGFFWSGPHPFFHGNYCRTELSFQPTEAKWVQLRLIQPSESNPEHWALAEIILYRSLKGPYRNVSAGEVAQLKLALKAYPNHLIYADTWLSAHLNENAPELNVADTWRAPVHSTGRRARHVDFSRPVILVVTAENRRALARTLKEARFVGKTKEVYPFILFNLKENPGNQKWVWTGKQLLRWGKD